VAPGSDLHVALATQHLLAAELVLGGSVVHWRSMQV
jgi:hypothetical protein